MSENWVLTPGATVQRIRGATRANEAGDRPLTPGEQATMIAAATRKLEELFDIFRIDHENDPHTCDTPRRVAKMFVNELMRGRFSAPPDITEFKNVSASGQLIITGPIEVRSTCAHHLLPIYGQAFIGILPGPDGSVVGLSKYDRIVAYFAARLQIQEELVDQIGNFIMARTAPRGLAVRISAVHMCKTHRGVLGSHESRMVTSAYFGSMTGDQDAKSEFSRECLALSPAR